MQQPRKIARIVETKIRCKKVYFGTKEAADNYVTKLQKNSKRDKIPVRSYLCSKCNCWHLTSWEAPDITKIFEEVNDEIDRVNAEMERMYMQDSKVLTDRLNKFLELQKENKRLELEIFVLRNKK